MKYIYPKYIQNYTIFLHHFHEKKFLKNLTITHIQIDLVQFQLN